MFFAPALFKLQALDAKLLDRILGREPAVLDVLLGPAPCPSCHFLNVLTSCQVQGIDTRPFELGLRVHSSDVLAYYKHDA
jgi:hypothetical protein